MTSLFSRGFRGRPRSAVGANQLPTGRYETRDFPVLSAGPTPRVALEAWDFTLQGQGGRMARWTWNEFQALPRESVTADSHCVTKWSKFGTMWDGVSVDTLLAEAAEFDKKGREWLVPMPHALAEEIRSFPGSTRRDW
jgi:DMSO/TMAO reductase YedYZ molybdopterin-dependent catalytic subunit